MKRSLLIVLALVLSMGLALGGTMAYLQDTDSDVNVMTLGNVYIDQLEKERIEQSDENTQPENIKDFTQGKPMYPGVYEGQYADWARDDSGNQVYQEFSTGGSSAMWTDEAKNAVDKIVFVENTGKSPAYVRTLFAFEQGDLSEEEFEAVLGQNINETHWEWETVGYGVEIDGNKYAVKVATYLGNAGADHDVHPNGVLPAGETTRPSLLQTMLYKTATNEDMEAIDGNGNGTYDILVLSQAVQTEGFADAKTALDTAFGTTAEKAAEWLGGVKRPIIVYTTDELREAMKLSDVEIYLGDDLLVDDDKGTGYCFYAKYNNVINLNGHDIVVDLPGKEFYGIFYTLNDAQLDIVGEGELKIAGGIGNFVWCTGLNGDATVNIYGGNWIQDSEDFVGNSYCEGLYANREGDVNIYGGTFNWKGFEKYTVNESREGIVTIYGGTFINFDPRVSHDTDGSYVAEGYEVISEEQPNGDIWYTVVKK